MPKVVLDVSINSALREAVEEKLFLHGNLPLETLWQNIIDKGEEILYVGSVFETFSKQDTADLTRLMKEKRPSFEGDIPIFIKLETTLSNQVDWANLQLTNHEILVLAFFFQENNRPDLTKKLIDHLNSNSKITSVDIDPKLSTDKLVEFCQDFFDSSRSFALSDFSQDDALKLRTLLWNTREPETEAFVNKILLHSDWQTLRLNQEEIDLLYDFLDYFGRRDLAKKLNYSPIEITTEQLKKIAADLANQPYGQSRQQQQQLLHEALVNNLIELPSNRVDIQQVYAQHVKLSRTKLGKDVSDSGFISAHYKYALVKMGDSLIKNTDDFFDQYLRFNGEKAPKFTNDLATLISSNQKNNQFHEYLSKKLQENSEFLSGFNFANKNLFDASLAGVKLSVEQIKQLLKTDRKDLRGPENFSIHWKLKNGDVVLLDQYDLQDILFYIREKLDESGKSIINGKNFLQVMQEAQKEPNSNLRIIVPEVIAQRAAIINEQRNIPRLQLEELAKSLQNKETLQETYALTYFPFITLKNAFTEWLKSQKGEEIFNKPFSHTLLKEWNAATGEEKEILFNEKLPISWKNNIVSKWFFQHMKETTQKILRHPELISQGKKKEDHIKYLLDLSEKLGVPKNLYGLDLSNTNLSDIDLMGVRLTGAQVKQILETGKKDLRGIDVTGADLTGINWDGAILTSVRLSTEQVKQILKTGRKDLSDVDLTNADLREIVLTGVNLTNAILTGARLNRDQLEKIAAAGRTDFSYVDLSDTDLADLPIENIKFDHADLRGANFTRSVFDNVTLTNAKINAKTFFGVSNFGELSSQSVVYFPQGNHKPVAITMKEFRQGIAKVPYVSSIVPSINDVSELQKIDRAIIPVDEKQVQHDSKFLSAIQGFLDEQHPCENEKKFHADVTRFESIKINEQSFRAYCDGKDPQNYYERVHKGKQWLKTALPEAQKENDTLIESLVKNYDQIILASLSLDIAGYPSFSAACKTHFWIQILTEKSLPQTKLSYDSERNKWIFEINCDFRISSNFNNSTLTKKSPGKLSLQTNEIDPIRFSYTLELGETGGYVVRKFDCSDNDVKKLTLVKSPDEKQTKWVSILLPRLKQHVIDFQKSYGDYLSGKETWTDALFYEFKETAENLIHTIKEHPGAYDLSGINFIDCNLSDCKLSMCTLTNITIDNKTIFKNADLSYINCDYFNYQIRDDSRNLITTIKADKALLDKFLLQIQWAYHKEIESDRKFIDIIIKEIPAYKKAKTDGARLLLLMQYSQNNPHSQLGNACNRVLSKIAAVKPSENALGEFEEGKLGDWARSIDARGLHPPEISELIARTKIVANGAPVASINLQGRSLPFQLYETQETPEAEYRVVNVGKILSENRHINESTGFISSDDFSVLLADLTQLTSDNKKQKKIDLIQIPLKDGNNDHYVQLQLFAGPNNTICANIIDSKPDVRDSAVTELVQKLIRENQDNLTSILFKDTPTQGSKIKQDVKTFYTWEQYSGSKCGLYVAAGMRASTEAVLAGGTQCLQTTDGPKPVVKHQHHLVDKTEALASLVRLTGYQAPKIEGQIESHAPEIESEHRISTQSQTKASHGDKLLSNNSDLNMIDESGTRNVQTDAGKQQVSVRKSGSAHVSKVIDEISHSNTNEFVKAVSQALTDYQNKKKGASVHSFFKRWSAGEEYVGNALAKLGNVSEGQVTEKQQKIAIEIAEEILQQGVKGDKFEVNSNSRVHYLLGALSDKNLITLPESMNIKNVSVSGDKFNATDLVTTPPHTI